MTPTLEAVARFLGSGPEALGNREREALLRVAAEAERETCFRLTARQVKKTPSGGEGVLLPGRDAQRLLRDAEEVLFFCGTLGAESARWIRRSFLKDPAEGVIADACASALLEAALDRYERERTADFRARGKFLTDRFSPGYGDLPLGVQRDICALLETQRRLGVTLTDSLMLLPEKTVTAFMGVCPTPQPHRALWEGGCETCAAKEGCLYRQRGGNCHG